MRTVRLRIRVRDVEPPVERVVDVPAASTLPEVHLALQAAVGWANAHLHEFEVDGVRYQPPDPDGLDGEALDEDGVLLVRLGERWTYLYDFGDSWLHDVEVLGTGGPQPGCVEGRGGCPLEDCGGTAGFERLQDVLADPEHPEYVDARSWVGGDLPGFDLAARDVAVRQVLGVVPGSVRLLLDVLGDGVKLTPAGHLPRAVVHAVQEQRPHWALEQKPVRLERHLPPLAVLREVMREVGLLRLRNGTLAPTKAATDDLQVVRRLRSWFGPDDGFTSLLTSAAVEAVVNEGPLDRPGVAHAVLDRLGPGWRVDGRPATVEDMREAFSEYAAVLAGLDLIDMTRPGFHVAPGPSASWLLPRVSLVAIIDAPSSTQPHYRMG